MNLSNEFERQRFYIDTLLEEAGRAAGSEREATAQKARRRALRFADGFRVMATGPGFVKPAPFDERLAYFDSAAARADAIARAA